MNMMAECEVSVISGISKLEEKGLLVISSQSVEDETNVEPMIDEQTVVDEESVVTGTQDEEQTVVIKGADEDSILTNAPVDEEVNEESGTQDHEIGVDEGVNEECGTQDDEEQIGVDELVMEEFPPLLSKGVPISPAVEYGRSTGNWVNAIKKPPHRKFHVKVEKEKLGSVASSHSTIDDLIVEMAVNGLNTSSSVSIDAPRIKDEVVKDEHVKSHVVEDEVVKEQIKLLVDEETDLDIGVQMENKIEDKEYENALEELQKAKELVESKEREMDSLISIVRTSQIALSLNDMDTEAFERQMLAEERLKTIEMELNILKSSFLKSALESGDASEVVASKAEEMEERERKEGDPKLKGTKVELIEEKSEKKRQKRLRMKERRKVLAVARGSLGLCEEEPEEANETASSGGEIREREILVEKGSINENKAEPEMQPLLEGNITQLESELRSQLRQKSKEKKLARKRSKKARTTKNKKTKFIWIWLVVVMTILIFFFLKYLNLQIH